MKKKKILTEAKVEKKNKIDRYAKYAPFILRIGLGVVFFWFGLDKLLRPWYWEGWMPSWMGSILPVSLTSFLYIQGIVELMIGVLLIMGLFTRVASLIASLILGGIISTFVFNANVIGHFTKFHIDGDIFFLILTETLFRDLGLLAGAIALILLGGGAFSLDKRRGREEH